MKQYPAPQLYRLDPVRGAKFIVPIALEGYDRGYNPMVQDHYEVESRWICDGGREYGLNQWLFKERVRVYSKVRHYDFNGKEFRCPECELHWKKWPDGRPDEVLLRREEITRP